ncbi:tRNA (uracil-O(2)-)-methyltransferase [Pseudozyma hubeiensis]|nr:tRNA (uracil-O(2)-)-methyltransferase [Pseudozyma hubeiensis]
MSSSNAECSTKPKGSGSKDQGGPGRTTVQHQQLPPRPKLVPTYPSAEARIQPSCNTDDGEATFLPFDLSGLPAATSQEAQDDEQWTSAITAPAYAPLKSWSSVMQSLIRHPERNSSNILRADIVSETTTSDQRPSASEGRAGWEKQWTIRRSLLPRRPNLDWSMLQDCSLFYRYRGAAGKVKQEEHQDEEGEAEVVEAVVVYTPLIGDLDHPKMNITEKGSTGESSPPHIGHPPPTESYIPFYHPNVRALAFHFQPLPPRSSSSAQLDPTYGRLSISLIPFSPSTFPPTHRLSRVALSLLTTLHMHTWGHLHSYRKRVHHDTLIPRSLYQDLYLSLKTKHASALIRNWKEATDPSKHVFEEMGIAAFLIGLWTQQYGGGEEDWRGKVKFVDVGCGNGLLTYILTKEGFRGVGLDMRARKSWAGFSKDGAKLREWIFNPASLLHSNDDDDEWKGAWLIGNHADQLTPWIPLLATHHCAQGFINLPCCYYDLDGTRDFPLLLKGEPGETLSRNEQYLAYISKLHQESGWQVELDPLRIPSTKNWCFVGRHKQSTPLDDADLRNKLIQTIERASLGAWSFSTTTHDSAATQSSC